MIAYSDRRPLVIWMAAIIAFTPAPALIAQEQEPEVILPACRILYPGGYDPNTVGVVEGRVTTLGRPERGPVTLRLESTGGTYIVLTAPAWYLEELKFAVREKERARVKGSKTMGADGKLYLVAQQIDLVDRGGSIALRDAQGKPAWSGCGPGGCGRRGR